VDANDCIFGRICAKKRSRDDKRIVQRYTKNKEGKELQGKETNTCAESKMYEMNLQPVTYVYVLLLRNPQQPT